MDDLIEALMIFRKYSETKWPTGCEHDVLRVYVEPEKVSSDDTKRLEELSFVVDEELDGECFCSFRFGSA